jgi:hypothetical protein
VSATGELSAAVIWGCPGGHRRRRLAPIGGLGSAGFPSLTYDRCNGIDWGFSLQVEAKVPPHRVQVDPFPHWIVGMGAPLPAPYQSGIPGRLTLQDYPRFTPEELCSPNGPGGSDGCWSKSVDIPDPVRPEEERVPGDVKDYRLGLRWRRLDLTEGPSLGRVPPICWDFDERDFNVGQDYSYGRVSGGECGLTAVSHIYETSSWGLRENGPNFLPDESGCSKVPAVWDVPSYQVKVPTYWGVQWKAEWDQWAQVGEECNPVWEKDPATGQGEWKEDCDPIYDWAHHESAWSPIDLRNHGGKDWFFTSWTVITTGRGRWCNYEYSDPKPDVTVRVPVLEVQSVLVDPCSIEGGCQ